MIRDKGSVRAIGFATVAFVAPRWSRAAPSPPFGLQSTIAKEDTVTEPTYKRAVEIVLHENATSHTTSSYVERMQREGVVSEPNRVGVRTILRAAK